MRAMVQAQLAMVIIVAHRLHGRVPDKDLAALWNIRVAQKGRVLPVTQYTAAFKGIPSRVNIINIAVPAVSNVQVSAVHRCVAWLIGDPAVASNAYGDGPEAERR